MTGAAVDRLGASEFLLLTTFRRDGSAVPTAVWVAPIDGGLGVWTVDGSAKVRRIMGDASVTLAECDRIGTPQGPATDARAHVLDAAGTDRVRSAIRHKYGLTEAELLGMLERIGPGRSDVGLEITMT